MFFMTRTRTVRVAELTAEPPTRQIPAAAEIKRLPTTNPQIRRRSRVPDPMSWKWLLVPLPLLIAFGCGNRAKSEDLYRESVALRRRGFTQNAIEVADRR